MTPLGRFLSEVGAGLFLGLLLCAALVVAVLQ